MPNKNPVAPIQQLSLKALRLRPGQAIQTQSPEAGAPKEEAQFLAGIEGKGVMVGPFQSSLKSTLEPEAYYFISGFNGQYDFSFLSQVLQVFEQPFPYALMTYPSSVDARLVRRAMRMKTSHPATVAQSGSNEMLSVTLVDISHCGAMVHSASTLGSVGSEITLEFSVNFEGELVNLSIGSTICHSTRVEGNGSINVGLAFKPISKSDKLLLYFLAQTSNE